MYNNHLWDPKKWPLLTGGQCSEVIYVEKFKMRPENCGRFGQVVVNSDLTIFR